MVINLKRPLESRWLQLVVEAAPNLALVLLSYLFM